MSIFRENPEYLEDIIDEMVSKKNLLKQAFKNSFINKLGELTTDIEEKLAEDSGDENGNFDIENWDFGEPFYFTELASYIHSQLVGNIQSIVLVQQYENSRFGN